MDRGAAIDMGDMSSLRTPSATAADTRGKAGPSFPSDMVNEAGSVSDNDLTAPTKHEYYLSEGKSVNGIGEEKRPGPESGVPRDITGWKWVTVVLAILSSTFLFALDSTIVAVVQPVIVEHFDSISRLSWLSVAFLIGAAATNLGWGKIYGQFNPKWTYILCVTLFEAGSAVCGAAPSMDVLIIGRAICGVGGSGIYVGVMTLLAATTTIQERPLYVGGTGLSYGLGTVLGPIIGGAFTDSSIGWRWSFYINLCIGAVCAPVYIFMLPNEDPRPGVPFLDRAREVDYTGMLLTGGAFASGVMAASFGGVQYPWNSGKIIGLLVCSGMLFILLGFQQVYAVFTTISRRIFPVEFLEMKSMVILFAMKAASGAATAVPLYMIPIFFQFTRSDSALESGVRLLPYIILMVFAIMCNGAILSAYGYYMPWYTLGGVFVLTGGALMYIVNDMTSVAHIYGSTILIGFGVGLFSQASFSVAQAIVGPEMVSSAVGFITCAQASGLTIALAIANSIFLNKSQSSIQVILPNIPVEQIQQAIAGAGSQFFHELSGPVRDQVLRGIVTAVSKTYILVITAGVLVALLSLLMKRERLFTGAGGAV